MAEVLQKYDEYITATIVPKTTGTISWSMTFAE